MVHAPRATCVVTAQRYLQVRSGAADSAPPGGARVRQRHARHALLPVRLLRTATRLDERWRRDDPLRRPHVLPGQDGWRRLCRHVGGNMIDC